MPPESSLKDLYRGDHVAPLQLVSTVDATELSLSYTLKTSDGGDVDYKLYIRRSTNRFVEERNADRSRTEATGRCLVWRQ
jgi:hypothetical protein